MKRIVVFTRAVLLLFPLLAVAEPTPAIEYLMREPVTLFDLGMLKLDQALVDLNVQGVGRMSTIIAYDWDKNRIKIGAATLFNKGRTTQAAKKGCTEALEKVKSRLGINPSTGKPLLPNLLLVSDFFSHSGFGKRGEPKNLARELHSIVELTAVVGAEAKGSLVT